MDAPAEVEATLLGGGNIVVPHEQSRGGGGK
jgi:hypothetical protein